VLVAAHLALLVACGVLFVVGVRTKRVTLKRWAVVVLPSGIAAAWTLFIAVLVLTGS
jgi:predicted cation transporter